MSTVARESLGEHEMNTFQQRFVHQNVGNPDCDDCRQPAWQNHDTGVVIMKMPPASASASTHSLHRTDTPVMCCREPGCDSKPM
jgi:hypothetical protein